MSLVKRVKFYAVARSRAPPAVYNCWDDAEEVVEGFENALFKSFPSCEEAEAWLAKQNTKDNPILLSSPLASPVRQVKKDSCITSTSPSSERFLVAPTPSPEPETECLDTPPPAYSSPAQVSDVPVASTSKLSPVEVSDMAELKRKDPSRSPEPSRKRRKPTPDRPHELHDQSRKLPSMTPKVEPKPRKEETPIVLSQQQQEILTSVLNGESCFITGSGGSGKSVLLREIIKALRTKYPWTEAIAVCASTGIAAVNIDGRTLHSWAGLGLAKLPKEELLKSLQRGKSNRARRRWQDTKVLLVDEVSMIDAKFFTKLEWLAQEVRNSQLPFGGIQLVFVGDYFQLPPVPESDKVVAALCFQSTAWARVFGNRMYSLKIVYRQADPTFIRILDEMRHGVLTQDSIRRLAALDREVIYEDGIVPIELYPIRSQVESANALRLAQLEGETQHYRAIDRLGTFLQWDFEKTEKEKEDALRVKLDKDTVAQWHITLKVGAQVMLIKNLADSRLVNGSLGTIVSFQTAAAVLKSQHDPDEPELAIAEAEQSARTEKEEYLKLTHSIGDEPEIPPGYWPVVFFPSCGQTMLLPPMSFSVENGEGQIEGMRDQIPLLLAWSLSVHKAQGQTLERVKVDLGRTFEKGQAYVALSRATCLEGLEVKGFDPAKVMAHPMVVRWYRKHFNE